MLSELFHVDGDISVLQDLRTISHQHALVTAVHQCCLKRACMVSGDGLGLTDRLLLSLIVHCAKDDNHARAMAVLDSAFTCEDISTG